MLARWWRAFTTEIQKFTQISLSPFTHFLTIVLVISFNYNPLIWDKSHQFRCK